MTTSVAEVLEATAWKPLTYMAKDELHLHTGLEQCEIRLLDISGRELLKMTVSEKATVPLHLYSSGIYLLRFVNPQTGAVRVQKIFRE